MKILEGIDVANAKIAIPAIEEKIRTEALANDFDYISSRTVLWKPISEHILSLMRSDRMVSNNYILEIDKAIGVNASYEKNNLPLELLLHAFLSEHKKLFEFPRYIAAVNTYYNVISEIMKPSPAGITEIIMDTVVDPEEEKEVVEKTLKLMAKRKGEKKKQTIPQLLFGVGPYRASKAFRPTNFEGLVNQFALVLSSELKDIKDFEKLSEAINRKIIVVNLCYNLEHVRSVVTYDPTVTGDITRDSQRALDEDLMKKTIIMQFPPEGAKIPKIENPYDEYGSGKEMFIIIDYAIYDDRYLMLGMKEEKAWNPIIPYTKHIFPAELAKPTDLWGIANEAVEVKKHSNFLKGVIEEEQEIMADISSIQSRFKKLIEGKTKDGMVTVNMREFVESLREFFSGIITLEGSTLRRAQMRSYIDLLIENILSDISLELEPLVYGNPSHNALMRLLKRFEAGQKPMKGGGITAVPKGQGFPPRIVALSKRVKNAIDYGLFEVVPGESIMYSLMPFHVEPMKEILSEYVKMPMSYNHIIDGTAHVGVDTLHFAKFYLAAKITAVEISDKVFQLLERNVARVKEAIKLPNDFYLINNSIVDYLLEEKPSCDMLYFDPPWGGRKYAEEEKMMLYLDDNSGKSWPMGALIKRIMELCKIDYIILKTPRNFDYAMFDDELRMRYRRHDLFNARKMISYSLLIIKGQ